MSRLTDLPEALLSSVFSVWLTVVDVTFLDSAFCSHALRESFTRAAYRSGAVLQCPLKFDRATRVPYDSMHAWIFEKDVSVDGFHVTTAFIRDRASKRAYLTGHGHFIKWIVYEYISSRDTEHRLHMQLATDIAECCPNLMHFQAKYCYDESVIMKIAQGCKILEELNLATGFGAESRSSHLISELAKSCTQLKHVTMRCNKVPEESLVALVRSNPGLLRLNIEGFGAADEFIRELALSCPRLTTLHMTQIGVAQSAIVFLLKHNAAIASLDISSCRVASAQALEPFVCNSLQKLHLSGVGIQFDALDHLLRGCPGLTDLDVHDCPDLRKVRDIFFGSHCPALQCLSFYDNTNFACDSMLRDVSEHCPQLRTLKVYDSYHINSAILTSVATHCTILEEVRFRSCAGVDDAFLTALAQNCRGLKILEVSGCNKITDAGAELVFESCPALSEFNTTSCLKVKAKMRKVINEQLEQREEERRGPPSSKRPRKPVKLPWVFLAPRQKKSK